MKSAIKVIKEQIDHFYLVRRLSLYEIKSQNKNNYLGMTWEIINPSIQILIYWFVFGTLRNREPVSVGGTEVPFFFWLLAAFFLWIFFYQSTIQGSKSIYTRLRILSKMNFPMSVIPNFVIFSRFYIHLFMLGITIVIFQFNGFYVNIYYLQLIYFIVASLVLIFSISLITSTLSTIIRDVHMFLNSTLRMLLYLSGVLWPITILSEWEVLMNVMKLNPLFYLIEGYRHSLFGVSWYAIEQWEYTLYFWGLVILLFLIGSMLHMKFRKHFIDYL
ncbi:ABC transporter permease [Virgibacillus doumboii]|uniref:ABC transporter permease n=1 Tax=Virgibacillus doumboii TaxID=2697503 RepID=UPI0013DF5128|nr:ABC transporter permease [Virgibacillus doumboii]